MSFVADDGTFQAQFSSGDCPECGDPILKRLWYTPAELWRKYRTYTLDEEEYWLARRYYILSWLFGNPSPRED